MTIIAYRAYNDIDIQFEDGTIKEHRKYSDFVRGSIGYYKDKFKSVATTHQNRNSISDRLHEKTQNTAGLWMEIIAYRGANDIDVRFDNGFINEHTTYQHFCKGTIRCHDNNSEFDQKKNYWIGKTKMVKDTNDTIIIVNYYNDHSIVVEFASTKTKQKTSLKHFLGC